MSLRRTMSSFISKAHLHSAASPFGRSNPLIHPNSNSNPNPNPNPDPNIYIPHLPSLNISRPPLRPDLLSTYEREVMTAKAHFDLTGEPFVKEFKLPDYKYQSSVETTSTLSDDKPVFYVHRCLESGSPFLTAIDANMSPKGDILTPFPTHIECIECANHSNGLFSFHAYDSSIYIFNPTTREYKIFSPSPFYSDPPPHQINDMISSSIWVDPKSDDYKVMRFFNVCYEDEHGRFGHVTHYIELYSHKTDSWKTISCPTNFHYCQNWGVCINGVFYIGAYLIPPYETNAGASIFSFDFSTETPSIIPAPPMGHKSCSLLDYNGLLCVLPYHFTSSKSDIAYELWVMRDGSWDLLSFFNACGVEEVLCSLRNGNLLFFKGRARDDLWVFDYSTGKLERCASADGLLDLIPSSESCVKFKLKGGIPY